MQQLISIIRTEMLMNGSAAVSLTVLERCVTIKGQLLTESGPVAQLGARMNGIHEVTGSIPVWSTTLRSRELTPKRELWVASHAKGVHHSGAA